MSNYTGGENGPVIPHLNNKPVCKTIKQSVKSVNSHVLHSQEFLKSELNWTLCLQPSAVALKIIAAGLKHVRTAMKHIKK